ncbi:MAG: rubredoxin-like domain-containing protein [Erysipelotrichaceae bacterium]
MKFVCSVCGYVYDDDAQKVKFEALPDDWTCPLCGAPKALFNKEENEAKPEVKPVEVMDEDVTELSFGQLAALCSNLARGCRKQYKEEEAKQFDELAAYFTKIVRPLEDATVKELAKALQSDLELYPALRATADADKDRGAARVCVWGEKVTRMLESLVSRYLKEGDKMAEGTSIWVCSVCGFVYIGDKAPELCPVCKVPAWKFDKVEGR